MAIMLLRVRANVPVILCGEAGCGKTSLIHFLSRVVEVSHFEVMNLHAGITENKVVQFMQKAEEKATEGTVWVFWDEVNTCNHLSFVVDIICHRMFLGRPVSRSMKFFAACNPYRLRSDGIGNAGTAGLQVQNKRYEEKSPLVYQVLPLPEIALDYVWDFGSLLPQDEQAYIKIMTKTKELGALFAVLLFESQQFMREVDGPYSVSLRDVKRAVALSDFFLDSFVKRWGNIEKSKAKGNRVKAMVLALGLSYQFRLYDQQLRQLYRQRISKLLQQHNWDVTEEKFKDILQKEELDYVDRMIIPPSTALNEALLENVLAMIVCILTRIPLFLVGAPGSSKSLAIRLVHQNLKGSDSNDPYFRTLPQGSSSSTSEGITKVFETARKYQEMNSESFPIRTVVLLDEIGLAEGSPFNPLKVLHYLLEPSYPSEGPDISVIGISNWRLDHSKTSRALLVQRPELRLEDLVDTATHLMASSDHIPKSRLETIAQAYTEYEKAQKYKNFHGLRDYYAFVKSLSKKNSLNPGNLHFALARNFGGLDEYKLLWSFFSPVVYNMPGDRIVYQAPPIKDLISANLEDTVEGRHLMVIGNSGSVIGILEHVMRQQGLDPLIIYGSQLPDDKMTNDYSYSVLNKILMCVESGRPLILMYGSLYDLWNQNYMAVGSKKDPKYYCRVALGEYANPMCFVHPRFRSILVLDENDVQYADPPLLNRFEKQRVSFEVSLEPSLKVVIDDLTEWTNRISTPAENSSQLDSDGLDSENRQESTMGSFTVEDMFVGFDRQITLASLVIYHSSEMHDRSTLIEHCKADLISNACSDAMVRSGDSLLARIDSSEVAHWKDVFFNQQRHDDLQSHIAALISKDSASTASDHQLIMIKTFSNINIDIDACLHGMLRCQLDKLSTFKSEAQLVSRVKSFWSDDSGDEMLIMQCDGRNDNEGSTRLAKWVIEQARRDHLAKVGTSSPKHVVMIFHLHRDIKGISSYSVNFDFLCGWQQVVIETLEQQPRPLSQLLQRSVRELINTVYPFDEIFRQELSWCLVSMKYPPSAEALQHMKMLMQKLPDSVGLIREIQQRVDEWLDEYEHGDWQSKIARRLLLLSSSFPTALDRHVRHVVRIPVAKIICSLERLSTITTYLDLNEQYFDDDVVVRNSDELSTRNNDDLAQFWEEILKDRKIVQIVDLAEPGPDAYSMSSAHLIRLRFPFSNHFANQIDRYRQLYQEESDALKEDEAKLNPETGELYRSIVEEYYEQFAEHVRNNIRHLQSEIFHKYSKLYFEDFIARNIPEKRTDIGLQHERILKLILKGRIKQYVSDPVRLHTEWWKHSAIILSELDLIASCGKIVPLDDLFATLEDLVITAASTDDSFEELLVDTFCFQMLRALLTSNDNLDINRWCQNTTTLLSFCAGIPSSRPALTLQLLRICNDFVSMLVIPFAFPLSQFCNALTEGLNTNEASSATSFENAFSNLFVSRILTFLNSLPPEYADCGSKLWRTFISRCLNVLPSDSIARVELYRSIFSEDSAATPLLGPIILRILRAEDEIRYDIVIDLAVSLPASTSFDNIESEEAASRFDEIMESNPRMQAINESLALSGLNSRIASLTCDVVQKEFFALEFDQLCEMLGDIKKTMLAVEQMDVLQSILVVAYMKEFVSGFWKHYLDEFEELESTANPIDQAPEFLEVISGIKLILGENSKLPIVESLRLYFLKGLRAKMSMGDVEQFCNLHHHRLPWLADLAWKSTTDETRLPFNPFRFLPSYVDVGVALANLADNNIQGPLKGLLSKAAGDINVKLPFLGALAMEFQFKQATRELNDAEIRAAAWIQTQLSDHQYNLSDVYRRVGLSLLENSHPLLQVTRDVPIPMLQLKSVLVHVIALHASMAPDASPLAMYLHDASDIKATYILACPSDTESVVLNALIGPDTPQLSRWSCQCGYCYVVGECGKVKQESICPQCGSKIGGERYVANIGNSRLDVAPVTNVSVLDQAGYIVEEVTNGNTCGHVGHSVRLLSRAAYRILHLFVHAVLPASMATMTDWQQYCLSHIENDWNQLKTILNCNDETLTFVLHAVVVNLQSLQLPAPIATAELRDQWEAAFSNQCVLLAIGNIQHTSAEFSKTIRSSALPSLLEIEIDEVETLMSPEYIDTHFPRLWRRIDDVSFDSFRAYYWSDPVRQEQYPFLAIFFEHRERLGSLQYLIDITKFVHVVSARLAYRLKRQAARNMTFREFIEQQDDQRALLLIFDGFARAWNAVRTNVTRLVENLYICTFAYGTKALQVVAPLSMP
ncbi:LOW QUALITY PROTEIN: hypothetical protein BC936DRAFT_148836 [Jimgerdemannia flammicorona]|uniref:RZ-type domain-containing protein n=1 Tax=Jimgerdemannia flammicorona TaxID=994334 RepID=A0A433DKB6_9FUNG|nr:LOW QUALITY PROTEIN: hypothetical protein BC936DRAFT_148836 [Jimgerdemannia flammicorona]